MKKYAKTLVELAKLLDLGREHFSRRYLTSPGNPGKTARGYDIAKWTDFIASDRKRSVAGDGSLRDRKLLAEIEILEAKRDEILGQLVPLEHHREQCITLQTCLLNLWEMAVDSIAHKRKDASLLADLRAAMDAAKQSVLDLWAASPYAGTKGATDEA